MSPILLRPVREQLEHDRVIRLLQARWKRRYQVGINPGSETNAGVGTGNAVTYPDVVLTPPGGRRPEVVIEVETGESVNRMEALFEWARLAQERAAFHLFVPAGSVEVARRLCEENHIQVAEIWTFHHIGEQTRFTQVVRAATPPPARRPPEVRARHAGAARRKGGAAASSKTRARVKSKAKSSVGSKAKPKRPAAPASRKSKPSQADRRGKSSKPTRPKR